MSPLATLSASSPPVSRCVVFLVAGHPLALPVEAVRRFLPLPHLDRLPTAPPPVEGVFRYHGEIVPVLRLSILLDLGAGDAGLYAPLILVTWQGRPLALLVDQVRGDVAVPAEALLPAEPSLSFNGCAMAGFADPAAGPGGTVSLLDPDRLLSRAEGRLLEAFRAAEERRLGLWTDGTAEGAAP
ncbi:chemotaxis protein CheW [Azospirillum agricola]|uniref:chemotaxis protein CheW n=1 Tax=Azospirillum agricola TaxID=1720247 RepID=UPI000A0F09CE|nr:chemotaxis protein CheW [Azospirillum agricola]SMH44319.1 purine-binding chemotaxis protein CheW [Azospirillum lipoferum]